MSRLSDLSSRWNARGRRVSLTNANIVGDTDGISVIDGVRDTQQNRLTNRDNVANGFADTHGITNDVAELDAVPHAIKHPLHDA